MIIHSLVLDNIRSYVHEEVGFGEGITLLAGDIGAGKSTVLLALEFALFGLRPGAGEDAVSGETLLRHGEKEGSVTLSFTCDHDVTIQRSLKRHSSGVRQDGGWLEVDGSRQSLTAQELKARILELLGYPEELLSKRKGFVYRYTVFTPQESMKRILFESDQQRLDTLRTVFGVDRYRTVQDNAALAVKAVREQQRYLEGQLRDLPDTEQERKTLHERLLKTKQQAEEAEKAVIDAKQRYEGLRKVDEEWQEKAKADQERQQALTRIDAQRESLSREEQRLSERLKQKPEEREPVEDPQESLDATNKKLEEVRQKASEIAARKRSLAERLAEIADEHADLSGIEECPRCKQPVSESHKEHIRAAAEEKRRAIEEKRRKLDALSAKADQQLSVLRTRLQELEGRRRLFQAFQVWKQQRAALAEQRAADQERLEAIAEERKALDERADSLKESLLDADAYTAHKKSLAEAQEAFSSLREKRAHSQAQQESLQEQLLATDRRLQEKYAQKQRLQDVRAKERWLQEAFVPAAEEIERHVLATVHAEFDRRFTEWFAELIEDERIFASLSEAFAPEVTQDGYDADLHTLSGGEKTAVALAYRLALNAVVSDFVDTLKTRELLILDEPTDGFSSQQLDRVRDVLTRLRCRQVILVSHEQKMEAFVDRVVRVAKDAGRSVVH